MRMLSLLHNLFIPELALNLSEFRLGVTVVTMSEFALFGSNEVMAVFFRKYLLVHHWLHGCMIVILMDLLVDSRLNIFMAGGRNSLMCNAWCNFLMHRSVMLARFRPGWPS